jgi:hypothetical protein
MVWLVRPPPPPSPSVSPAVCCAPLGCCCCCPPAEGGTAPDRPFRNTRVSVSPQLCASGPASARGGRLLEGRGPPRLTTRVSVAPAPVAVTSCICIESQGCASYHPCNISRPSLEDHATASGAGSRQGLSHWRVSHPPMPIPLPTPPAAPELTAVRVAALRRSSSTPGVRKAARLLAAEWPVRPPPSCAQGGRYTNRPACKSLWACSSNLRKRDTGGGEQCCTTLTELRITRRTEAGEGSLVTRRECTGF